MGEGGGGGGSSATGFFALRALILLVFKMRVSSFDQLQISIHFRNVSYMISYVQMHAYYVAKFQKGKSSAICTR